MMSYILRLISSCFMFFFFLFIFIYFFFFKQKTAYEIKECDWSSDVCSSDLSCLQYEGVMDSFGAKPRKCFSVHSPVKLEIETDRVTGIAGIRRLLSARMLNRVERGCLARSDLVTTFSKYTHMLLRQLHGEEIVGAAEIVPGWVDVDRFRILDDRKAARDELGWPVDRPVLFTLRRLVPRMGVDRLLAALSEVSSGGRDFMMVIAGEGPMKRQLETMAGDLSLGGRVKFAGFVKDEQLPLMYGAADAFILPTAELECFGLIAIESLACGRPVLATPVAAIPEIIGEIEPSWLAKDESAASIANLIKDFCSGKIPMLEPEVLRRITEQRYSKRETLPKLVAAIIDRVH